MPISCVANFNFQFSIFNPKLALELVTRTISIGNIQQEHRTPQRRRMEALRLDDHPCSSPYKFVELFGVPVRETETPVGFGASYAFGKRCTVYSISGD